MERVSGSWNESVFCVTQKRTKQNSMFWGTVVEPGARVVITVPSSVQGLRITRALPYEMESGFPRHFPLYRDSEGTIYSCVQRLRWLQQRRNQSIQKRY